MFLFGIYMYINIESKSYRTIVKNATSALNSMDTLTKWNGTIAIGTIDRIENFDNNGHVHIHCHF